MVVDTDNLLDYFDGLYATGGGDCPDAAISGILRMLSQIPAYSRIIVFTDGTANDYQFLTDALDLVQEKRIKVYVVLSDDCDASRSDPGFSSLEQLTVLSSGLLVRTEEPKLAATSAYDSVFSFVKQLIVQDVRNEQNLLVRDVLLPQTRGSESLHFWVDYSITSLQVIASGTNVSVAVANSNAAARLSSVSYVAQTENLTVLLCAASSYGWWNLNVGPLAGSLYSVRVVALYEDATQWNWQHAFVREIDGRAIESLRPFKGITF